MDRTLRNELRKTFSAAMTANFPEFVPEKLRKPSDPGVVIFKNQKSKHFTTFIGLALAKWDPTFTVEIAGNASSPEYPWEAGLDLSTAWTRNSEDCYDIFRKAPRKEFRFRISELKPPHRETWWPVTSEKMPELGDMEAFHKYVFEEREPAKPDLLPQSISTAIAEIRELGIPYLDAVVKAAEKYGVAEDN